MQAHPLASCRAALGFLTILPVAPRDPAAGLARARAWFPAVGLLLGAVLAALDAGLLALHLPPLLAAALLVAVLAVLTRGLHLDGFMDSCDALFGGYDRERRLEILRDPHVGAFAVAGVACLLLVKFAALATLPEASRARILLLFPCLSRTAILLVMEWFPYLRREGLGTPLLQHRGRFSLWCGLPLAVTAAVLLTGLPGLVLAVLAGAVAWAAGAWATRLLGGVTGDIYGAVNETVEAAVLVLAVTLTASGGGTLGSPLAEFGG